ncbi:MAG TPA: lysylphosphatidylglycerol synthase domain-containing protein [Gemmatimonadaceae bacterium]
MSAEPKPEAMPPEPRADERAAPPAAFGSHPRTIRAARVRSAMWIVGGLGLALAIALVVRAGIPGIRQLLDVAGWRLLWLAPIHIAPLALDATGWRRLLRGVRAPGRIYLTWAAVVREAVSGLLPVARVGGEVVGARLLIRRGVAGTIAGASVIVELTLTMGAQLLFAGMGLVLLLSYPTTGATPRLVALGLAVGVLAVAAFFLVQHRWGMFELIERVLRAMVGRDVLRAVGNPARLDQAIRTMYREHRALVACTAWQLAGLCAGAIELWITLRLLGQPSSVRASFVVESLTMAVQSAMFFVPAGLGTQEGSFVLVGMAVGLSPEVALALSLARRVRQLLLGVPALIGWYGEERLAARERRHAPRETMR